MQDRDLLEDEDLLGSQDLFASEVPSAAPQPQAPAPKPRLTERLGRVAKETGIGAAAGFAAPEIMTGLGLLPTPLSPFLLAGGQALRGQRLASSVYGAIGGGAGETAAQISEAAGGTKGQQELSRLVTSTLAPEPVRLLGRTGGYLTARAMGAMGLPGTSKVATVGQLLEREGVSPGSLTAEQRAFINQKIGEIRGGKPSLQAQQEISDMLRSSAARTVGQADEAALRLETEANQIVQAAQAAGGRIDDALQQRISNLQGQFESAAERLRLNAQNTASQVATQARNRANMIMQEAMQQSPQVQQLAKIDADQIIAQGRQQADQILSQSQQRVDRLRDLSARLRQSGAQRVEGAAVQVGEPARVSQIGRDIRDNFTQVLDNLKATRKANADVNKQAAFGEAFQKEAAGLNVRNTKAAANAIQEINTLLLNPVSKLPGVPAGEVRTQLQRVKDAISGQYLDPMTGTAVPAPQSFEGLEIVRRSLRDRASGLPAEGFDAIGQQQAGRLADLVEKMQVEFSPSFAKFLQQYKIDSQPINKFANDLGKAITGRSEADFNEYAVDPAKLAARVFESENTVRQLINTAGPEQAERIARTFVASRLRGANATQVSNFINDPKTQDWLFSFPTLERELMAASQRLGTAESVAGRRSTLAGALRTEMGRVPTVAGRAMTRAEEDAAREAAQRLRTGETAAAQAIRRGETAAAREVTEGERAAEGVLTGAEQQIGASAKAVERQRERLTQEATKAAQAGVTAAEAQAKGLTKQAQAIRDKAAETARLLTAGEQTGPARVRDLIMSEKEQELVETAKVIMQNPAGKEKFAEAVSQVVADLANKSVKSTVDKWKYVGNSLEKAGLIDANLNKRIADQLQEIMVSPVNAQQKATMAQSMMRNLIAGYAVPGVVRAGEAMFTQDEDLLDATR